MKNKVPLAASLSAMHHPTWKLRAYVVSQLQKAGCLVWFDKEQLTIGQDWKEELREAVEERCGFS